MLRKIYHIVIIFLLAVGIAACSKKPSIPSLRETYSRQDKNPFGGFVMYEIVKDIFAHNTIRQINESFNYSLSSYDNNSLSICITPGLFLEDEDVNSVLDYVSYGNDLFISSSQIDDRLLKKVSCNITMSNSWGEFVEKPFRNTHTDFLQQVPYHSVKYNYFYFPFLNYFEKITYPFYKVLSNNEVGKPNCVVFFYGKGKLFLHCDPRAFSNYFLLKNDNYQYLQSLFGYVKSNPDCVYWNEYYNKPARRKRNDQGFSALDTILKHPPLRLAFWLSLLLLLLYILFQGKRRQRIVEYISPNVNTSVTFTETVGRLYLQKKDNYNIAQKMITYFNEYVRNNYFLNAYHITEEFITTLSRKSGVSLSRVESLYRAINYAKDNINLTDTELLLLNEQMQLFFRHSK